MILVRALAEPSMTPLKNTPQRLVQPNSVVTTHERLAMKKVKVHSLTGRITPELMEQAFKATAGRIVAILHLRVDARL
jgi:hypothetical protein